MASLLELQHAFASALRGDTALAQAATNPPLRPARNIDIYRNNTEWQFRHALALSFPVLLRRVGEDYFRQLASLYRASYPSRSGDLHWVGRHFAEFLGDHLGGGDYAWLADLAQLEWACELAAIAAELPALRADALALIPTERLAGMGFGFQPSLKLGASPFPVASVWLANQQADASPVDQSLGSETYLLHFSHQSIEVRRLDAPLYGFISALTSGSPLGDAMTIAGLEGESLVAALRFIFDRGLVVELTPRSDS